ncbi:MAG: peptidoglycan DD-metalloendopeptidase family protein [Xanthomonadales bacterium]|nr:peptidoglycan DD-metalloendopeptidase family protein [Xanthomonadales bacterium]MDH4019191.1 peptidoglycan DD-metalloendopeptidase family protein [Xanthomonadales bacterium]
MFRRQLTLLGMAAWLILGWMTCQADEALTKAEAESRLKRLKTEISSLRKELERTRSTLSNEQKSLKAADLEIQSSALELRRLESTRQVHEDELSVLHTERRNYLASLEKRRDLLAEQIMAAYRLGRESRLKLVLNQDSPALLSRTLAYYDYFSRSQSAQISELKQVLKTLDQMQVKINVELSAIDVVQRNQQAVLDDMTDQRNQRKVVIENLASQIDTEETRLAELQRDRHDLEELLEKLSNVLADIPADLGQRQSLDKLKGKLPIPVKGRVKHAYGQPRTAGLHWQGWLISASIGSEVKSIAHGRVAYADWLRGYGLLLIIDHGDGFMSLYANNESLLREVGDWVETGSDISTVGTSPLNGNGLYFEIRKDSKAMDPAVWLKR